MQALQSLVMPWREMKKSSQCRVLFYIWSPSDIGNPTEQGLTLLIRRSTVLSLWYSGSTLNIVFYFLDFSKDNKERNPAPGIETPKPTCMMVTA